MATKRTPLLRRSLAVTEEMITAFQTIQREFKKSGRESDAFHDAFQTLHMALRLYPCHPTPALCPPPETKLSENEFMRRCYFKSWTIRQKIEEAIAAKRRAGRSRVKPTPAKEYEPT